ncbi:hypothetical protein [Gemmatimonas sp.]|uniref:hypothetical protein n=1 Tax=Gemmatimonas sp. TaxID=1962908 RepID=UPI0027B94C6A|nr:hypothetical protein [Gemmatimonas sp.]
MLPRFAVAVAVTTAIAWVVVQAMQRSAEFDLTGQIETVMPLARIGLLTTPILIAVRGGIATLTAWLMAGALDDRITMRLVALGVLTWLPLLELPALVDAIAMLLQPQMGWAGAHVPLGLDAFMEADSPRLLLLTRSVNLALLAFAALIARDFARHVSAGAKVAIPMALAAAAVLVVLPLLPT